MELLPILNIWTNCNEEESKYLISDMNKIDLSNRSKWQNHFWFYLINEEFIEILSKDLSNFILVKNFSWVQKKKKKALDERGWTQLIKF